MSEEKFVLDTRDGCRIYGLLNRPDKGQNDKAVIHIHGLSGSWMDHPAVAMAASFPKKGYDVIRPNLYHWEPGGRSLFDCTILQHAMDIDQIVRHFKKKYRKVFATGHSYAGPSLMTAKINQFDAVSLWDPTYLPCRSFDKKDFIKTGEYYISLDSATMVLSNAFIEESKTYDRAKAIALAKKCKIPLQVIYAAWWAKEGESFHTHAKGPIDERKIPASNHAFYEEGTTAPLLRYTKKWFDRF